MKGIIVFVFSLSTVFVSGQHEHESVGPLMQNPLLVNKSAGMSHENVKLNVGSFDSTFVYLSDTLTLPIFDEFSTNKFQTYGGSFSDPSILEYRLLDLGNMPLSPNVLYTAQQTFKRTFDVGNGTFVDSNFVATQIQVGDMTEYPTSYTTTDAFPPFYIYDTLDYPNPVDTIWILDAELYQDSARQFFSTLNDPDLYWLDNEAFHNYTMAKDPWSLGVVTFDGLDEKGFPYALGGTTTNFADHFTSKPIDMTGHSPSDSVYFSFLYQPQGLCDQPEIGDSLILEFYDNTTNNWNQVWSAGGEPVTDFKVGHIRIMDAMYYTDAFQFRFKNWGGLSGSLDHFHLDYVHLRATSGYQDTVFNDFAMVYPVPTLLETYTSVPWDHYVNSSVNRMSTNVHVSVRNGDVVPINNSSGDNRGGVIDVYYGGAYEGSDTLLGSELSNPDLNYNPQTVYHSYHDFTIPTIGAAYEYDNSLPGPFEEFDFSSTFFVQTPNFSGNDTTYNTQYFKNYYAYDDGSAELAYGPTGIQSRLAVRYDAYEADSLIGVKIHFVPSVTDVSNNLFYLCVWDDGDGKPGALIYQDSTFFPRSPIYEYDRNIFTTYYFEDTLKVAVGETFYVGWRQVDPEPLGVGLDMNIVNNDKTFYSIDSENSWPNSTYEGSVMMRPVFSTSYDPFLGIREESKEEIVSAAILYPNPTTALVNIQVDNANYNGVEVYNLQGLLVDQTIDKQVDLSNHPAGMYIFKLKGSPQIYKVIKK